MKSYISLLILTFLLISCGKDDSTPEGPHFSVSPVPLDMLARISELGENGKIFPVAHTYWTTCDEGFLILPSDNPCHEGNFPIRAPGNGTVKFIEYELDGEITFESPSGLLWTFAHITPDPGLEPGMTVEAGEEIALMYNPFSFDFGLINYDIENEFISPHRYPDPFLHGQHPIEQFAEPLKSQLIERLAGASRQIGRLSYDVESTASGGWFREGSPENDEVFVYYNTHYLLWMGRLAENPESRIMNVGELWPGMPEPHFTYMVDNDDPDWEDINMSSGRVQLRLWQVNKAGEPDGERPLGSVFIELMAEDQLMAEWFNTHQPVNSFSNQARIYVR